MTAVAGIVENGVVYLGADSAGSAGTSLAVRSDPQGFHERPLRVRLHMVVSHMGQLLNHAFKPPAPPRDSGDLDEFMVVGFVDALRECLKFGGFAESKNEVERGGEFLVGVDGRLFTIESDYQVAENVDPYAAVGCGADLALGSLHTTLDFEMTPSERIDAALLAAERFSAGVRGPFHHVRTP
jgi:hypothetical protein